MNIGVGQDFLVEPVVVEECGEHQDLVDGFVDQHGLDVREVGLPCWEC